MAHMTERMQELFNTVRTVILSTATTDGSPNAVPVGAKKIIDAETILISDQFFNKTLANMKAKGMVPQDAELTGYPEGVGPWDELDDTRKKVFTRLMETFAGFAEHTDAQVGKLVDALEEIGLHQIAPDVVELGGLVPHLLPQFRRPVEVAVLEEARVGCTALEDLGIPALALGADEYLTKPIQATSTPRRCRIDNKTTAYVSPEKSAKPTGPVASDWADARASIVTITAIPINDNPTITQSLCRGRSPSPNRPAIATQAGPTY